MSRMVMPLAYRSVRRRFFAAVGTSRSLAIVERRFLVQLVCHEVGGVHAGFVAASLGDSDVSRAAAGLQHVGDPVGEQSVAKRMEPSGSVGVLGARPIPAGIGNFDLPHETLVNRMHISPGTILLPLCSFRFGGARGWRPKRLRSAHI